MFAQNAIHICGKKRKKKNVPSRNSSSFLLCERVLFVRWRTCKEHVLFILSVDKRDCYVYEITQKGGGCIWQKQSRWLKEKCPKKGVNNVIVGVLRIHVKLTRRHLKENYEMEDYYYLICVVLGFLCGMLFCFLLTRIGIGV